MELLNDFIDNWYPVLWLASAGIALVVWAWASNRKARLDIDLAINLIMKRRYRNGQISKKEYIKRKEAS